MEHINKGNTIYIVEDVSITRLMLEQCLSENGFNVAGSAADAENAWKEIVLLKLDLVLVDIHLVGEKSGIWLGKKLNEELKIPFMYITANQDQNNSSLILATNPQAFIVKPINIFQLITTINITLSRNVILGKKQVLVQDGLKSIKLNVDDIFYIQSDGNYLHIYLENNRLLIRSTMDSFLEKVAEPSFLRIHQRYVINSSKRFVLRNNHISINNTTLKISLRYKKEVKDKLNYE